MEGSRKKYRYLISVVVVVVKLKLKLKLGREIPTFQGKRVAREAPTGMRRQSVPRSNSNNPHAHITRWAIRYI